LETGAKVSGTKMLPHKTERHYSFQSFSTKYYYLPMFMAGGRANCTIST
jgi:hypothetical protein